METTAQYNQTCIGDYRLAERIGQGAIAEVYRARHRVTGAEVAIKILSSNLMDDPDTLRRFERESILIARLRHPNIVQIIDEGRAGQKYYFVMELLEGTSFREIMASPEISLNEKLRKICRVCEGLAYAHEHGVIHRDIKPANILIGRDGHPRLADFGIAQIISTSESRKLPARAIMGTLPYMSPEQKTDFEQVDPGTDIYALGVIIYEILTGHRPAAEPKPPSELHPQLGCRFDQIISKCLAERPTSRYHSALALRHDLAIVAGETISDPSREVKPAISRNHVESKEIDVLPVEKDLPSDAPIGGAEKGGSPSYYPKSIRELFTSWLMISVAALGIAIILITLLMTGTFE